VCEGFCAVEIAPSPKFHAQDVGDPVGLRLVFRIHRHDCTAAAEGFRVVSRIVVRVVAAEEPAEETTDALAESFMLMCVIRA